MVEIPEKLFVHREDARSPTRHFYEPEGENSTWLTPLCDSVRGTKLNAALLELVGENTDLEADNLCSLCQRTDKYSAFVSALSAQTQDSQDGEDKSRWDKYQEWIEDHEWGSSNSPEEILSEGKLLVAPGVRESPAQGYTRKLHAYEQTEAGQFTSKCGLGVVPWNSDFFEGMKPGVFVGRADACKSCSRDIDADSVGTASTVDYDPFGVFDKGKQETDLPEIPDSPDEYVCPSCGEEYSADGIGQHWGHPKSDCEYPDPSKREKELLTGLWLAGAALETKGTYPVLRKTSIQRYPLDWLNHELGLWGTDVSKSGTHTSQQANIKTGFDYDDANSHAQYRLTTRTCPFLSKLDSAHLTDIEMSPLAARVLFSFRGFVVDQSAISIRHPDGPDLVDLLHSAGFTETSLYEPAEGKTQWTVTLSAEDSRRFADWIGGEPLPGFTGVSKQLSFRERGEQGATPTRRVTPDSSPSHADTTRGERTATTTTVSLEPDWEWLGVCLAQLNRSDLAKDAFNEALTPNQVYGEVLDLLTEHQDDLPEPNEVGSHSSADA